MSQWLEAAYPLVIAHRGASASAPENTLSSFALAVSHGAEAIEFDVRLSSDGQPVILHDVSVDRTTNGRGAVSNLTVKQLQSLDAGEGQPVPTLEQVFDLFGPTIIYNIELKEPSLADTGLAAAVASRIQGHHLEDRILISSFNPLSLRRFRSQSTRHIPQALIHRFGIFKYGHLLTGTQADHPHFSQVGKTYITWAKRRGLRIHVWTVDDPIQAKRLSHLGVNGIITNQPKLIRHTLNSD